MKKSFLGLTVSILIFSIFSTDDAAADRERAKSSGRSSVFNIFKSRPAAQAPSSTGAPAPAYCTSKPQSSSCGNTQNSQLMSGTKAADFIAKCPQSCDNINVVSRETWGASPTLPTCTSGNDNATFKRIDDLKLQRGQAECKKNKAQYDRLNRAIEGIREPSCIPPLSQPKSLVIHHTTDSGVSGGVKNVSAKGIQQSHMKSNGWSDIGYHYLIAMDEKGQWQIYEGRKKVEGLPCTFNQGGHGGPGLNSDSLGIAIAGDYEPDSRPSFAGPNGEANMQAGAVQKLAQLVGHLKKECPSLNDLSGHGDHQAKGYGCDKTQCPGKSCEPILNQLKEIVAQ